MSTKTIFHYTKSMRPGQYDGTTWLTIEDKEGNNVTIFMPYRQAEMIAKAFAEYENWGSGQEGPTFDDAWGAKCDAIARQEAARAMK